LTCFDRLYSAGIGSFQTENLSSSSCSVVVLSLIPEPGDQNRGIRDRNSAGPFFVFGYCPSSIPSARCSTCVCVRVCCMYVCLCLCGEEEGFASCSQSNPRVRRLTWRQVQGYGTHSDANRVSLNARWTCYLLASQRVLFMVQQKRAEFATLPLLIFSIACNTKLILSQSVSVVCRSSGAGITCTSRAARCKGARVLVHDW
jgi:hypothetical protein